MVRVKVKPEQLPLAMETFSINFQGVKSNAMDVVMAWDRTFVRFPVTTDIDTKITGQIKSLMSNDNRPYYGAAMYYMDNGKDLNQALVWFNKAAELNPDAYWVQWIKERIALPNWVKKPMLLRPPTNLLSLQNKQRMMIMLH